ncbi:hypothetical protein IE53DRAFT_369537 [Violaceomyces palustris]|uniref:Uncharacterized protein n=1 Tax=Violaceomyces palustris TaxID=1673888 RepID=A0ACD0NV55_9BASI|nr:hypothetical protein IE53DRAFT_369537 [Violaceomyces palustris]
MVDQALDQAASIHPTPAASPPPAKLQFDLDTSIIFDPILELCPSIDILRQIARLGHDKISEQRKRAKLSKALLRASSNGDTDILGWLLDPKAEARSHLVDHDAPPLPSGLKPIAFNTIRDDDDSGPVVLASCAGHVDAVRMLVLNGADVDERDSCGWTPLMWATNSSNLPLVSFLLSHGADVEARSLKGTSCEDFILSAAPDAATSGAFNSANLAAGPSRPYHGLRSPYASDRELIADMIYEHQQTVLREQANRHRREVSSNSAPGLAPAFKLGSSPLKGPSMVRPQDESEIHHESALGPLSSAFASPVKGHSRSESQSFFSTHSRQSSSMTASRRLVGRSERTHLAEQELKSRELAEGRRRALLDIAVMLEVEYATLIGEPPASPSPLSPTMHSNRLSRKGKSTAAQKAVHSGLASGCGAAEVGGDILSVEFDWEQVRSDQMLVFGLSDLAPLLEMMISDAKPYRAPWTSRAAPANVIFLCARYACSLEDEELLEELILGAIDRIEGSIYAHPTDMTSLAFWLYNCSLLHFYTQKDALLSQSETVGEYRALLADLLNEIYVFVIRDAERRIDKVLDTAILDHDAIPGMEEVRFEGEWSFMRTLAGSVKNATAGAAAGGSGRRPMSQIFGRKDATDGIASPSLGFGSPPLASSGSSSPFRVPGDVSPQKRGPEPLAAMREASYNATAQDLLARPSPRTITTLLTSTLHVLQLYEINPAIIIQALSQVFYWVGCELFNRVLTRKRYLCRSRAMQIRLSVSALEDWARSNALPLSIVHAHLSPLSQLVSWIQCQSSLREFDGLIATMQGLRALNPLQMRKAVRDYRYEVGESRMSEECVQYLDQLIKDWQRRQKELLENREEQERTIQERKKLHAAKSGIGSSHHRSGTATQDGCTPDSRSPSPSSDGNGEALIVNEPDEISGRDIDASFATSKTAEANEPLSLAEATALSAQRAIDNLFLPGKGMSDYVPPWTAAGAPLGLSGEISAATGVSSSSSADNPQIGELLNSRDMLPFALPTKADALIVSPGDSFGFGRGHFTGTGAPSLKSVRADSPGPFGPGATSSFDVGSRPESPSVSNGVPDDRTSSAGGGPDADFDDQGSVSEASARTGASNTSRSSLFPTGKGFAAGASWSPVPVLPDGLLDKIDELMRNVSRAPLEHRISALAIASPVVEGSASFNFGGGSMPRNTSDGSIIDYARGDPHDARRLMVPPQPSQQQPRKGGLRPLQLRPPSPPTYGRPNRTPAKSRKQTREQLYGYASNDDSEGEGEGIDEAGAQRDPGSFRDAHHRNDGMGNSNRPRPSSSTYRDPYEYEAGEDPSEITRYGGQESRWSNDHEPTSGTAQAAEAVDERQDKVRNGGNPRRQSGLSFAPTRLALPASSDRMARRFASFEEEEG